MNEFQRGKEKDGRLLEEDKWGKRGDGECEGMEWRKDDFFS
jgi:hypothetical protein